VRSFSETYCDIDNYVVVANVSARLAVSKQVTQNFHMKRFNLRKLNKLKVSKQCQITISNRLETMKNLNYSEDVIRAWKNIKENVKTSAKDSLGLYDFKQHSPWVDAECLRFLDQRKQATMQCLQDPNQNNVGSLNKVRCEASRHFRNEKKGISER